MRNFINSFLRLLAKIVLHGYYRKIIISGKENIPRDRPILLVVNHQNALIDPIMLATHIHLKPYFLTRASVFKNSIAAKMLDYIRLLPVYRVRDGFSTIQQNQLTFEKTYDGLHNNGSVMIFAEGSHSLIRNLRPLSKGFTRIAFGLKEKYPETNPVILPVALDYSSHMRSGGIARITIGKAIQVHMPASKSGLLTKSVEKALKNLVVEIPAENYHQQLKVLIENRVDLSSRNDVKLFLETGEVPNPVKVYSGFWNKVMKIFNFPLYWVWLWKRKSVKDPVFSSTWKFLIGYALGPSYYLVLIWLAFGTSMGSWALSFLIMAWVSVYFNRNPQE